MTQLEQHLQEIELNESINRDYINLKNDSKWLHQHLARQQKFKDDSKNWKPRNKKNS